MSNENTDDFLAHYGVKGMKWGTRREVIITARGNAKGHAAETAKAEKEYLKAAPADKASALKKLKEKEKAEWENKEIANTATRGEQIAIGILGSIALTPIGGLAAVAATGAYNRDTKRFRSQYPDKLKGKTA